MKPIYLMAASAIFVFNSLHAWETTRRIQFRGSDTEVNYGQLFKRKPRSRSRRA